MFGTIRKHQTWLWAVIITLTIISFVVFFSPYSKVNQGGRGGNFGSINGQKISREDYMNAKKEAILRYFLMTGSWPDDEAKRRGYDEDIETYKWLLIIQKEQDADIHVNADAVADYARQKLAPLQREISSPAAFVSQVLQPRGFTYDDFERAIRHEVGLHQLIGAFGLAGRLITPQEATALYDREHQELVTQVAFLSATNFLATVTPTQEGLTNFFMVNLTNRYLLRERVQVSYVKFPVSNYMARAESELKSNVTEIVDQNMQRMGTNFTRFGKTPEEARTKMREEIFKETALGYAVSDARDFARPLMENDKKAEDLEAAGKTKALVVGTTEPFEEDKGPKGIEGAQQFTAAAFTRTVAEPVFGPLRTDDGAYVIALKARLPSEVPKFEAVKEQVTSDYKLDLARAAARRAGNDLAAAVTNGLAAGKTFEAVCADKKIKALDMPPFSISTRTLPEAEGHISLEQLKQIAFSTPPGQSSGFYATLDGGVVLFVKARLPVDVAKARAELPAFIAQARAMRQNEAFNNWFRKEIEKGLRDTPLIQRQAPPSTMSGGAAAGS